MSMPLQKPGKSRQDYQTPKELVDAVCKRLNINHFTIDLAASDHNTQCDFFFTEEDDALSSVRAWDYGNEPSVRGWAWLNPPYSNIEDWVCKASKEAKRAQIVMLVPSSVGSNWWRDWVEPYAYVVHLNGRLTFVGETTPYPKDCSLLLYTPFRFRGTEVWDWRGSMPKLQQQQPSEDKGVPQVPELSL